MKSVTYDKHIIFKMVHVIIAKLGLWPTSSVMKMGLMLINKYKLTHKNKMVLLVSCCLLTLERCSFENISIVMLLFYCHTFPHAYWTEVAYSSKRTYSHMKKKKNLCSLSISRLFKLGPNKKKWSGPYQVPHPDFFHTKQCMKNWVRAFFFHGNQEGSSSSRVRAKYW